MGLFLMYSLLVGANVLGTVVAAIGIATFIVGSVCWRLREASRRKFRARTLGELLSLTPKQFEHAVADLLHDLGYRDARVVGGAGDLHVDIWARDRQGKRVAVQCKRYAPGQRIGSPDMQTFVGMLYRHHQAELGIYVTTSDFTEPARSLARDQRIWLIDGNTLTRLIGGLDRPTVLKTAATEPPGSSRTRPLLVVPVPRYAPSARIIPSNIK